MYVKRIPPKEQSKILDDADDNRAFAIASLILSLVGYFLVALPFISLLGVAGWILGIILGFISLRSRGKIMALAGIILSIIGIVAFVILVIQSLQKATSGFGF